MLQQRYGFIFRNRLNSTETMRFYANIFEYFHIYQDKIEFYSSLHQHQLQKKREPNWIDSRSQI